MCPAGMAAGPVRYKLIIRIPCVPAKKKVRPIGANLIQGGEGMIPCNPLSNADRIRAMSDRELAAFLERISIGGDEPWEVAFKAAFCDHCPTVEATDEDGKHYHLVECDFEDGVCPHGRSIPWWLRQPQTE